ncbi:MAG: hypothetical protein IMY67_11920 [Bacteroidetes bacterium]|nr:hypothetical protein [Bacteroidota bacterium]
MSNLKAKGLPFNKEELENNLLKFAMEEVKNKLPRYDLCSYASLASSVSVIFDSISELKQCDNLTCSDYQIVHKSNVLELKINSLEEFIKKCRTHMNSL